MSVAPQIVIYELKDGPKDALPFFSGFKPEKQKALLPVVFYDVTESRARQRAIDWWENQQAKIRAVAERSAKANAAKAAKK